MKIANIMEINGLKNHENHINPYWQIIENSSRNFSEIFIFRMVTQAVLLENSSIRFFWLKPYTVYHIADIADIPYSLYDIGMLCDICSGFF